MSFFESLPAAAPEPPLRRPRPAWVRSDAVVPASVPAEFILVRTEEAAIAQRSVTLWPDEPVTL